MNMLKSQHNSILSPLRIAVIYAVFGALWIFFSDLVLNAIVQDPQTVANLQTGKGWFYVIVTATLVYLLTRSLVRSLQETRDVLKQFNETLEDRVSERTRELAESEAYLRAVVDDSAEAIVTLDEHGKIETFNPQAERIFGYTKSEIIGKTISTLLPPENRASHEDFFFKTDRFAKTISSSLRDLDAQRRDGSIFPIKLNVSQMRVDGAMKFVGIMRDITDRKDMEKALMEAKTTAEDANRAKTEFLSAMSHELRTPLNAIIGFSDSLIHNALGPISEDERKEYLDHIKTSGEHLLTLVNEILDLSRIEAGKVDLNIAPLAPADVVGECLELLQSQAQAQSITVHADDPELKTLRLNADRIRFKQILLNLMSNGLKYNSEGGHLYVRCQSQGNDTVRLSITDTGEGIAPKDLPSLFVPFNRLNAEERGIKGTGIGLTVSKNLVELMGGRIGVDSTPGQGSTFWVDMPGVS